MLNRAALYFLRIIFVIGWLSAMLKRQPMREGTLLIVHTLLYQNMNTKGQLISKAIYSVQVLPKNERKIFDLLYHSI